MNELIEVRMIVLFTSGFINKFGLRTLIIWGFNKLISPTRINTRISNLNIVLFKSSNAFVI